MCWNFYILQLSTNGIFYILYAICRQLLVCYYPTSCNTLETGMADWLVKIMPTVELIEYICIYIEFSEAKLS